MATAWRATLRKCSLSPNRPTSAKWGRLVRHKKNSTEAPNPTTIPCSMPTNSTAKKVITKARASLGSTRHRRPRVCQSSKFITATKITAAKAAWGRAANQGVKNNTTRATNTAVINEASPVLAPAVKFTTERPKPPATG